MSRTTYRLVENFEGEVTEQEYTSLVAARASLAQAVSDLVAEGFVIKTSQDDYATLVCQNTDPADPDYGPLVTTRLAIHTVTPLTLTDVTGMSREEFAALLDVAPGDQIPGWDVADTSTEEDGDCDPGPVTFSGGRRYYQ